MPNIIWVADDGSWGSGDVGRFDVTDWTESEIEQIEEADDRERLEIARNIADTKLSQIGTPSADRQPPTGNS